MHAHTHTHTGNVFKCKNLAYQQIAKFTHFMIASNSGRLICCVQKFMSTYISSSLLLMYNLPLHELARLTLPMVSISILFNGALSFSSPNPLIVVLILCLMIPTSTYNHPHTERCPTSLLQIENTFFLLPRQPS